MPLTVKEKLFWTAVATAAMVGARTHLDTCQPFLSCMISIKPIVNPVNSICKRLGAGVVFLTNRFNPTPLALWVLSLAFPSKDNVLNRYLCSHFMLQLYFVLSDDPLGNIVKGLQALVRLPETAYKFVAKPHAETKGISNGKVSTNFKSVSISTTVTVNPNPTNHAQSAAQVFKSVANILFKGLIIAWALQSATGFSKSTGKPFHSADELMVQGIFSGITEILWTSVLLPLLFKTLDSGIRTISLNPPFGCDTSKKRR